MSISAMQLCLVTANSIDSIDDYLELLSQAIDGGVTSIQYRQKQAIDIAQAKAIQALCRENNVAFIVNDNVELAYQLKADGIHLGQSDTPVESARHYLGADYLIGLSMETLQQCHRANQTTAIDYIAASSIFSSTNKSDCRTYWGLTGLKQIVDLSYHPVVAIGGINSQNITDVMVQGAAGVAVIAAIHDASNPKAAAKNLSQAIRNSRANIN